MLSSRLGTWLAGVEMRVAEVLSEGWQISEMT